MTASASQPESTYAWLRLAASLALMTISGVGMYAVAVALPAGQAEFGVSRSEASLPYTLTMIGFGLGGILMGRLSDRFGVMVPVVIGGICLGLGFIAAAATASLWQFALVQGLLIGAVALGLGFVAAGHAASLWQFALAQGLLIGLLGTSAAFAPLVADTSLWFTRRRGIAVAICASGNYLGGAIWPPVLQHFFETNGWRATFTGVGMFCIATMVPLAFALRRKPPVLGSSSSSDAPHSKANTSKTINISPKLLLALLCVAGVSCCVAMSMPQVHIVAYCGDLGFPAARGAEMLSVMLGFGVVSRLASGWICDRIGGLRTLLLGSVLQGIALIAFLPFDGLVSLFVV